MSNARWDRIQDRYHAALERPASARAAFLREVCDGDRALVDEVQSLLDQPISADQFLESGESDAENDLPSVRVGQRVGIYQVQALIGRGGMGEVYRARDPRLGRDVAIKMLPLVFMSDRDRVARFEREARVLASLNHLHIASIYGLEDSDGVRALVLELVEGDTLADRLARGPLTVAEALATARQIADALEAAHEKGIVHRDLKPANVKITPDGVVKVLDFGLAKLEASGNSMHLTQSPTVTVGGTRGGLILGTAAYVSPEQARGHSADKRTDIWAFGCVLYEMFTGQPVFNGDTATDVLAAVMRAEPDWAALPADTPPLIGRLLRRCLEKDPKRRLHDIADARLDLDDALTAAPADANLPRVSKRWARWLPWGVAATVTIIAGALAWRGVDRGQPVLVYASIDVPADFVLGEDDRAVSLPNRTPMVFTPDGRSLIIQAAHARKPQLFLRSLDRPDARPIVGTEDARAPFVSPDGRWVAFTVADELKKVPIEGGAPTTICSLGLTAGLGVNGAAWGTGNVIVFGDPASGRIMRVSANGGTPFAVTAAPPPARWHVAPVFLPDGQRILFSDVSRDDASFGRLMVQALNGGDAGLVVPSATDGRLLPSGQLAFMRVGTLMTVGFDVARAEAKGEAVATLSNVMQTGLTNRSGAFPGAGMFAVSSLGTLAVVKGALIGGDESRLVWLTRDGQSASAEPASGVPIGGRSYTRIAPDGSRAIVAVTTPTRLGLWIADWARDVWTACGDCDAVAGIAVWSPDGRRLLVGRKDTLVVHTLDGSRPDQVLVRDADRTLYPAEWLTDGRVVYAAASSPATPEIKLLDPGGSAGRLLARGNVDVAVSPDARWLAFSSVHMGQVNVIVQAFPGPGVGMQVSAGNGFNPAWSADGRTLYYLARYDAAPGQPGSVVFAVDITTAGELRAGTPRELFRYSPGQGCGGRCYDISANGPRFLFQGPRIKPAPVTRIDLVLNWTPALPTSK
jgi:serine/threonine protein kinase